MRVELGIGLALAFGLACGGGSTPEPLEPTPEPVWTEAELRELLASASGAQEVDCNSYGEELAELYCEATHERLRFVLRVREESSLEEAERLELRRQEEGLAVTRSQTWVATAEVYDGPRAVALADRLMEASPQLVELSPELFEQGALAELPSLEACRHGEIESGSQVSCFSEAGEGSAVLRQEPGAEVWETERFADYAVDIEQGNAGLEITLFDKARAQALIGELMKL